MFQANRFRATVYQERITEHVGDVPILGFSLSETQSWAVKMNGGTLLESSSQPAQLWIREDVYVTHSAIGQFIALAKEASGDVYWKAKDLVGGFVSEIGFHDPTPMLVWLQSPAILDDEKCSTLVELHMDVKVYPINIDAPNAEMNVDVVQLPLTEAIVVPMGHWSQTLWGNLLALGPYLWRELIGDNAFKQIWNLLWGVVRAMSKRPDKLMRVYNKIGNNCRIHPSAVVEASILGDHVVIGANAVVRGSILRDRAKVEDLALVEGSILSSDALVQRQAMVKYSVLHRKASVAGVVQLGVIGEEASVKRGGYLMDMNFGSEVQVCCNQQLHPAPLGMIGCGISPSTIIGLGVQVAAGRWVPPNLKIVMNPEHILLSPNIRESSKSDDAVGLMIVRKGRLEKPQ